MKEFLNGKLSKKATVIAVILIALFVLGGNLGAVLGHRAYLNGKEAKIVNYSVRENSPLRMRKDGTLSYRYKSGATVLDAADLLILSDGASMQTLRLTTDDNTLLPSSTAVDVRSYPHTYMFLRVTSDGGKNHTDYILEIVSESDYREDAKLPAILSETGPIIQ